MAQSDNSLRNGIWATVIGGLILALLQWLFGLLRIIWNGIVDSATWLGELLAQRLTLPAWALVLIFIVGVSIVLLLRMLVEKRSVHRGARAELVTSALVASAQEPARSAPITLTVLEEAALRFIARSGRRGSELSRIARQLSLNEFAIEQALEGLQEKDLIHAVVSYMHPTQFRLTSAGRDLAFERNYISVNNG